jgi:hypothetical protein
MSLTNFIFGLNASTASTIPDALNAGSNQIVDAGDTVALGANQPGLWTTTGTGTFSDNNINNPVYTPTVHDIALGAITMTLTVGTSSDSVVITFNVTEAYVLTLVSHYWDAEDATDSGGDVTAWVDRKAGATTTNIGTPTIVTSALSSRKAVNLNGTSSALATAKINYKSMKAVARYRGSGVRLIHVPISNASSNFHAGWFRSGVTAFYTYGASGDNKRLNYALTAAEQDTDLADNVFYNYSFRNLIDFRRNMLQQFSDTETTTTDVTSSATNMFFGCRRLGNNTGTADQFAAIDYCAIFFATTEWTIDQSIIIDRYINARWPAVKTIDSVQYFPLTASITNRLTTSIGDGHTNGGGAGNFYPPAVVKVGTTYSMMAKTPNSVGCMRQVTEGSESGVWPEVAGQKINSTSTPAFNGTYAYRDGSMLYDGVNYHNWFVARSSTLGTESVGYVSAVGVTAGRTGQTQKLTADMINTGLGTPGRYTGCGTPKVVRDNGQYYLFVNASGSVGSEIVMCTMDDIAGTNLTVVKKLMAATLPYNWVAAFDIIKVNNKYVAIFHKGLLETSRGQRAVYLAVSDTIDGTYKVSLTPVLEARWTTAGAFDEGGVYDPEILVTNDGDWLTPQLIGGKVRIFFAGYSLPVEIGQCGYFDIDPALYEIATF